MEGVRHAICDGSENGKLASVKDAAGYPGTYGVVMLNPDGSSAAGAMAGGSGDPDNGVARQIVGNVSEKFKDSFGSVNTSDWDWTTGTGDALFAEGNVASSNYVAISKGVAPGKDTAVTSSCLSKNAYNVPFDVMAGVSLAVRMNGTEFAMETVGIDSNGSIIAETPSTPVAVQGTITISSNVGTVNFNAGHNFRAGDPVVFYGNAYSPLNVGPVLLTPVQLNPNQFTFPCTAANGTYTAGGFAVRKCPCGWAEQHTGIRWVGTTAGNADAVSENDDRPMVVNWNPGNSQDTASIPNEGGINYASQPYTVSLRPKGEFIIQRATEYTQYTTADQDSTTPFRSSAAPRRQNNPKQEYKYKLRFRAETFENFSQPVGAVTVISKSGSTTETVTCPNHGLTVNDFVTRYGARDQTNFANITTPAVVASVIGPDQFTVVGTGSFTGSSYGGFVVRVNGNQNVTAQAISVQTYAKTTDGLRLSLVGSGTWTPTIGTIHTLYGLVDSTNTRLTALEGRYRVAAISTTTMELVPLDNQDLSSVSTTPANAGGTIIANPDFRLHYAKLISYARLMVEPRRATGDRNRAMAVEIVGSTTLGITSNSSVNIGQVAGGTVAANNGTASANTMRVVIASDNTANSNPWLDTLVASAAQGASTTLRRLLTADTNAASIKASAGCVNSAVFCNDSATKFYVKLYNKASAPTLASDTPVHTIPVPANTNVVWNCGPYGNRFSTGIALAVVRGIGDTDTTAVAANDGIINMFYT